MAVIRWIFALPIIVICVYMALSNRESIDFIYSPLNEPISIPLYYLLLLALAIGFVLGAILTWINGGKTRKERREQKKTIKSMQKELDSLHKKAIKADNTENFEALERPIIKND